MWDRGTCGTGGQVQCPIIPESVSTCDTWGSENIIILDTNGERFLQNEQKLANKEKKMNIFCSSPNIQNLIHCIYQKKQHKHVTKVVIESGNTIYLLK